MRSLELIGLAAQAEAERWKLQAARQMRRAMLVGIAGVLVGGSLAMADLTAWLALSPRLSPLWAASAVAGANLLLALLFVAAASGGRASAAETEALAVRTQALTAARDGVPLLAGAATVFMMMRGLRRRR